MDAINARLDRAREHLQVLDRATWDYFQTLPFTYTSKFTHKSENIYDWVFTIHISREIPLRVSAIFGDGIQNVRTTLDYIVHRLAVLHKGQELATTEFRQTQFPIFANKNQYMAIDKHGVPQTCGPVFNRSALPKIAAISPEAWAIIETLQPYHGEDNILLSYLQQLSNTDKHRHLHVLMPPPEEWTAGRPLGGGISPERIYGLVIRDRHLANRPFRDGQEVARLEVSAPPDFDWNVRVKHAIPGDLDLQEAGLPDHSAGHLLAILIGFVQKRIVNQLAPYFE